MQISIFLFFLQTTKHKAKKTENEEPKESAEEIPVLDDDGKYYGFISSRRLMEASKKRVILVEAGRLKKDYEKGTYYNERY